MSQFSKGPSPGLCDPRSGLPAGSQRATAPRPNLKISYGSSVASVLSIVASIAICIAIWRAVFPNYSAFGTARRLESLAIALWIVACGSLLVVEQAWLALPGAVAMGLIAALFSTADLFVFIRPFRRTLTKVGLRIAFGVAGFYTLVVTPLEARDTTFNVILVQVLPAAWYLARFLLDEHGANRPGPSYPERARYAAEPGWYPDPNGGPEQRWFDGINWR